MLGIGPATDEGCNEDRHVGDENDAEETTIKGEDRMPEIPDEIPLSLVRNLIVQVTIPSVSFLDDRR